MRYSSGQEVILDSCFKFFLLQNQKKDLQNLTQMYYLMLELS